MKTHKPTIGRKGEEDACGYLSRNGPRILAPTWRGGHLELDIVTLLGSELHIVEVKSRTAPVMAAPERNVGPEKQRRLVAAANAFLHSDDRRQLPADLEVRFDIVSVTFYGTGRDFDLEYYPNAFIPLYA